MKKLIILALFIFACGDPKPNREPNIIEVEDVLSEIKKAVGDENNLITDKQKTASHALKIIKQIKPVEKITIKNINFYLSKRYCRKNGRPIAVLYVDYNGQWFARVLYRSTSNGIWRVAPYSVNKKLYSKGLHYSQDFLLDKSIEEKLEGSALGHCSQYAGDPILAHFDKEDSLIKAGIIKNNMVLVNFKPDALNYKFGEDFPIINKNQEEKFFKSLSKKELPHGFAPDFEKLNRPSSSYDRSHSIFSKALDKDEVNLEQNINVDVFLAKLNNRDIEWHFAYVKGTKEPWIAHIRFKDAPISSYGGDKEIIDSKSLTMKPVDYKIQVENMDDKYKKDLDKHSAYYDVRAFIQEFPIVKDYKRFKDRTKSW